MWKPLHWSYCIKLSALWINSLEFLWNKDNINQFWCSLFHLSFKYRQTKMNGNQRNAPSNWSSCSEKPRNPSPFGLFGSFEILNIGSKSLLVERLQIGIHEKLQLQYNVIKFYIRWHFWILDSCNCDFVSYMVFA